MAWRSMAAPTGERTLIPTVIPPGATFVTQSIYSLGTPTEEPATLAGAAAQMSSLLSDYVVRAVPKSSIPRSVVWRLPYAEQPYLSDQLCLRFARLVCLTSAYAPLWRDLWLALGAFLLGSCLTARCARTLAVEDATWSPDVPLRRDVERRQALLEIDALVALLWGVTADQLCSIYRTNSRSCGSMIARRPSYDANGRLVPNTC